MAFHEVNYTLTGNSREELRKNLIKVMLDEKHGNGRGDDSSRYQYNVESYQGYTVYLKRPTQLNKGFDFTVNIGGLYFKKNRRYSNPSHQDIFDALNDCKINSQRDYALVSFIINQIYSCGTPDLNSVSGLSFHDHEGNAHPIAIILLAIKWLFMEQDCAYWNYSGRDMFFSALKERDLV